MYFYISTFHQRRHVKFFLHPRTGEFQSLSLWEVVLRLSFKHSLVLDYMSHHCYTNTAHAFLRDTAIKQFDADGDEVELPMSSAVADTKLNSEIREAELRDGASAFLAAKKKT